MHMKEHKLHFIHLNCILLIANNFHVKFMLLDLGLYKMLYHEKLCSIYSHLSRIFPIFDHFQSSRVNFNAICMLNLYLIELV